MRSCDIYVLKGTCLFAPRGEGVELDEGYAARFLTEGDYELTVLGSNSLSIVMVWKLPEAFWKPAEPNP
jgi:hypothetical protein